MPSGFRGRVAFNCPNRGAAKPTTKAAMVWTTANQWRPESSETRCLTEPDDIRDFCRRVYPGLNITNVEPAVELESFSNWCSEYEKTPCSFVNARPYECLSGPYQSPSLLVSSVCRFMHNSSETPDRPSSCHRAEYWEAVAKRTCQAGNDNKREVARYGLLLPCDFMHHAGYFAGVEFVCCPEVVIESVKSEIEKPPPRRPTNSGGATEASAPELLPFAISPSDVEDTEAADADDARYQRYLAMATEAGHSEHERFAEARRGLQHHQARREGAMVRELSEAEARILRLSPRDPESAKRLLDEVEKQFRRSFLSVQREEEAEHDQLDSVHQQRIGLLFIGKLSRIKRLMSQSVSEGNAKDAGRYFARLAGLIAREVVRLANRAGRLSGRLTRSHLEILRQHAKELLTDLKDSGADFGLRRVAGLEAIAETLSRHEVVLKKAQAELAGADAAPDTGDAYPPKLAERFDNLLRLYHKQSVRVLRQPAAPHPSIRQPASTVDLRRRRPDWLSAAQPPRMHQEQQPDRAEDGANGGTTDSAGQELNVAASVAKPQAKTSPFFIGLFCGLAAVMTLVAVFVTVRICRMLYSQSPGKGYKLSLVDDDYSSSDIPGGGGACHPAGDAPYSYPTVKPEKACLGDPHLANMQMNGYENPTYKFYEEK